MALQVLTLSPGVEPSLSSRAERRGRSGTVVWLTGRPCAGKTTVALAVRDALARGGTTRDVEILDGDEVRQMLSADLGFSPEDRNQNVRRIGFVARLLARHSVVVVVAAVSPYAAARDEARRLAEAEGIAFFEVHVDATDDVLVARDGKGHYGRALAGELRRSLGQRTLRSPEPTQYRAANRSRRARALPRSDARASRNPR